VVNLKDIFLILPPLTPSIRSNETKKHGNPSETTVVGNREMLPGVPLVILVVPLLFGSLLGARLFVALEMRFRVAFRFPVVVSFRCSSCITPQNCGQSWGERV